MDEPDTRTQIIMKRNPSMALLSWLLAGLTLIPVTVGAAATLRSSTKTPQVGQPFTIVLSVDGSRVSAPEAMDAPGMSIRQIGQSRQFQFGSGGSSSTVTFTYRATPEKEGRITIPAVEVEADGRKIKSNTLELDVAKDTGGPRLQPHLGQVPMPGFRGSPPGGQNGADPKIDKETAFLKIAPERRRLYVGETVEVEMKAYIDAELDLIDFDRELRLPGEEFIVQPSVGPNVTVKKQGVYQYYQFEKETLGDREYRVLSFRTSLTAVKPGEFAIDPLEYRTTIRLPRPDRRRPRSLLDSVFGDPFDDPAFLLNPRGDRRVLTLRSEPLTIEVIPLPAEGRPENYDGAIGRFSLEVETDKKEVRIDEPLTLTSKLTGHGNFERIKNVSVHESPDWKEYPVKSAFQAADELKLSGEKQFEQTFIAMGRTALAPQVSFSYFDPVAKEYVVLKGPEIPVVVTGRPRPAEPASSADAPSEFSVASIPLLTADSVHLDPPGESVLDNRLFWAVNLGALFAALGLFLWRKPSGQPREPSPRRQARLRQREAARRLERLQQSADPAQFADEAAALMALVSQPPSPSASVSNSQAAETGEAFHRSELEELTKWIDEARWSSRAQAEESFGQRRDNWLAALEWMVQSKLASR